MLETLSKAEPDKILSLIALYRDDPRHGKVDLGVGVYKDAAGATPIMRAVREAEKRLYASQTTKSYLGMAGDLAFNRAVSQLALGDAAPAERVSAVQTPGGSGALRVLGELLHAANPAAAVWLPDPSWSNHEQLLGRAGLRLARYPYVDASGALQFEAMREALRQAPRGDVVLLHGCCHNPTGVDLSATQWRATGELLRERELLPLVDLAYQGFGDGLAEDAAGLRGLLTQVPELVVAASCSKNFSVYRDRVGAAIVVARNAAQSETAYSQLMAVARTLYSMPPDHGAAAVSMALSDPELRADWEAELTAMRERMQSLRRGLAEALRKATNSARFDFLAEGKGMFSLLGVSLEQVERLRHESAVYMVDDSRINVAGLREEGLDELARKIAAVL